MEALTLVQVLLIAFLHALLLWWVVDVLVRALFRKIDTKSGSAALPPREPRR